MDAAGNAYVTGTTDATSNFPIKNAAQPTSGGGTLPISPMPLSPLTTPRLPTTCSPPTWGAATTITATAIAVFTDRGGHGYVHVIGDTYSTNFPTKNPIQANLHPGQYDAFVAKIDVATGALVFSTYLGGTGLEQGKGIATDRSGNAYVTGNTQSTDFPTRNPYQANSGGGNQDAFVAKIGNPPDIAGPVLLPLLLSD